MFIFFQGGCHGSDGLLHHDAAQLYSSRSAMPHLSLHSPAEIYFRTSAFYFIISKREILSVPSATVCVSDSFSFQFTLIPIWQRKLLFTECPRLFLSNRSSPSMNAREMLRYRAEASFRSGGVSTAGRREVEASPDHPAGSYVNLKVRPRL